MSHEEIKLATPTRMFTFEQLSRDIDKINDIDVLRDMAKSHIKLYLKQQEVVASLGLM
jgi:hypothetical protein|tara:strand:+ start:331 stop:504 length:174 start_codon:yes stop_codon:yes gene_type:complete